MFALRRPPAANSCWFRVVNKLCLAVCPRQPVPLHVEKLTGLNKFCISNADVCTKKTPCSKFLLVQGGEQAVPGIVPPAAGPLHVEDLTGLNKFCISNADVCTKKTSCSKLLLVQGGEQAVPGSVPPAAGPTPRGEPHRAK
jgi:hypothetical protein